MLPLVILGMLTSCDRGTSSPLTSSEVSQSPAISTPATTSTVSTTATTATTATTVPLSASARQIFRLDNPGRAFRSTDAPCPVLADELVSPLLSDEGFPEVQVSYAESGATIFFHCLWGGPAMNLRIAATWFPNIEPRLSSTVSGMRERIVREMTGVGIIAGFTASGEFEAFLSDGVALQMTSTELSDDELAGLVSSVVNEL